MPHPIDYSLVARLGETSLGRTKRGAISRHVQVLEQEISTFWKYLLSPFLGVLLCNKLLLKLEGPRGTTPRIGAELNLLQESHLYHLVRRDPEIGHLVPCIIPDP
jgi:hypothetical protein